jgi:tetratricopeptide (TPR) repeat protein
MTTARSRWASRPARAAARGARAVPGGASSRLGHVYDALGAFGRAADLRRQHVEPADLVSGRPGTNALILSQAWRARPLSWLGACAEGRRSGEEARRLATREGRGRSPILAHGGLGLLCLAHGDLEDAIRRFDQGLALGRASALRIWLPTIAAGLGAASALQGRLAAGRTLREEASSEHMRTGGRQPQARWIAQRREVGRLAGHGEEAGPRARQALAVARQRKDRGHEAHAFSQLGAVHASAAPPDVAQAEAHDEQALILAEALGMGPLQAHGHLGLGPRYSKIDRRKQARTVWSTALEMSRGMALTFWRPQAEAALAQLEG